MPELTVPEIDILWITAGLSCDGDTVSITAATQPSIEDLVLGVIPGIPRIRLHNPVLAYANGDDFLEPFRRAAEGKLKPFVLVVEGSIPNEKNKSEGYWAGFGTGGVYWALGVGTGNGRRHSPASVGKRRLFAGLVGFGLLGFGLQAVFQPLAGAAQLLQTNAHLRSPSERSFLAI